MVFSCVLLNSSTAKKMLTVRNNQTQSSISNLLDVNVNISDVLLDFLAHINPVGFTNNYGQ